MPPHFRRHINVKLAAVLIFLVVLAIILLASFRPTGHAIASTLNAPASDPGEGVSWYYDCDAPGMLNLCPLVCVDFARDEEPFMELFKPCAGSE
jgi:hypothetical protein